MPLNLIHQKLCINGWYHTFSLPSFASRSAFFLAFQGPINIWERGLKDVEIGGGGCIVLPQKMPLSVTQQKHCISIGNHAFPVFFLRFSRQFWSRKPPIADRNRKNNSSKTDCNSAKSVWSGGGTGITAWSKKRRSKKNLKKGIRIPMARLDFWFLFHKERFETAHSIENIFWNLFQKCLKGRGRYN